MNGLRDRCVWAVAACLAAIVTCSDAKAQGTAASGSSDFELELERHGDGHGDGRWAMGFMPMLRHVRYRVAEPDRCGGAGDDGAAMAEWEWSGWNGQSNNIFMNPMAAPMLSGSMYPMSHNTDRPDDARQPDRR